jgi:O-antigen/teichoic acid export membrane protein
MNSRQTLFNIITRFGYAGGSMFLFLVASHFLGSSGRGELSLFITNLTFIHLIIEIIFGSGYIYLSHRFHSGDILKKGLVFTILVSFIAPLVLTFTKLNSSDLLYYLMVNTFLFALNNIIYLHLRSIHKISLHNLLLILSIVLQLILTGLLFYNEVSVKNYIIAQALSYVIIFILGYKYLKIPASHHEQSLDWKNLIYKGAKANLSNWLNFVGTRLSYYVIILSLHTTEGLGIYSAACIISESIWIIPFALATPLYPLLSKEMHEENKKRLTNKYAFYSLLWSIGLGIILLLIPESIYLKIIGTSFQGLKSYLYLLIPAICIHSAAKIIWNYFQAGGYFKFNTYTSVISILSMIISMILLTPSLQIVGVAWATAIGYFTYSVGLFTVYLFQSKNHLKKF